MAEDPIIVRPGVYRDPNPNNPERKGICLLFDDDSWDITEDETGITIKIPPGSRWKIVDDFTPPWPEDSSVVEDPPVRRKKKVALIRMNAALTDIAPPDKGNATIFFTVEEAASESDA